MSNTLDTFDENPSCATTINSKGRKTSLPLRINCNDTGKSAFYDTSSINDISPTTAVSSKRELSINQNNSRDTSLLNSIKNIPNSILYYFKRGSKKESTCSQDYYTNKGNKGKQSQNSSSTEVGKMVRHSYSDPRLSPGSTAVGDDDEERHGYFGVVAEKKKKSPRGWIAAVMMIVVGALIAITFVLVGLGKVTGSDVTASQHSPNSTTTFHHNSSNITASSTSTSILSTTFSIETTFTLKPTQT